MLLDAEGFLIRCFTKDTNLKTFDDLRNDVYYKKATAIDIEKFTTDIIEYTPTR